MEPTCLRLWMKCSLTTSRKIQLSPGNILAALPASSGCTQVRAHEGLLSHHARSWPRVSASSVLRFSCVGSVETTWMELQIKHSATQAKWYTYAATNRKLSVKRDDSVSATMWLLGNCVCVCVYEGGVISRGFVIQLVLHICHLIHLSLIWQAFTVHPCVHFLIGPSVNLTIFLCLCPGIRWIPDENGVVTFDCRNRNW